MNSKNNAKTILIKVIGFLIIRFFFTSNETISKTLFIICAVISLAELISPTLGSYIVWFWNELAHMPGWINTRILLSIVFYVLLLPIAFIYRLTNKDSLQCKKQRGSIFKERNHMYSKADLENIW